MKIEMRSVIARGILLSLIVLFAGCGSKPVPFIDDTPYLPYRNGLSDTERIEFYHLSEGGDFVPRYIFDALEHADGGKFSEKMHRYGFIQDSLIEKGSELPIGVSVAKSRLLGIEMVGFSCAACHVSDIHYQGKRIRIDGAPNTINVYPFYSELLHAAEEAFEDAEKSFEILKKATHLKTGTMELLSRFESLKGLARDSALGKRVSEKLAELKNSETSRLNEAYDRDGRAHLDETLTRALDGNLSLVNDHVESLATVEHDGRGPLAGAQRDGTLSSLFHDYLSHIRLMWGHIEWLRKYVASNEVPGGTPLGHGRVDAFGTARNLLFLEVKNYLPCNAPVSIPHLWGFKNNRWMHWNSNTNTVMQRNIVQALGTGAVVDTKTLNTSIAFANLDRLDELAGKTTSPPWPIDLFGPIDEAEAKRGEVLYREHCASCHDTGKIIDGLFEYPLYALADGAVADGEKVGTDPGQARNFDRLVNGKSFTEMVLETASKIEERYYDQNDISEEQRRKWRGIGRGNPRWRSPLSDSNTKEPLQPVYPAKPLRGVWATAPYLHNGSVPNLYALLSEVKDRPTTFYVGVREYDPVNMGFQQDIDLGPSFIYDTTLAGNSAIGHEFGTDLSREEKYSLIEYLKTK